MSRHVRWGGQQIHHVASADQAELGDDGIQRGVSLLGPGDCLSKNTKLHRWEEPSHLIVDRTHFFLDLQKVMTALLQRNF